MKYYAYCLCLLLLSCDPATPNSPRPPPDASHDTQETDTRREPTVKGQVEYLKRIISPSGSEETEWRPVGLIDLAVHNTSDNTLIATGTSDREGLFEIQIPTDTQGPVKVRAYARASDARLNITVHRGDAASSPWEALSGTTPPFDIRIEDRFTAGAFNVTQLAVRVADQLEGLVPPEPPELLSVRWSSDFAPLCGSCFFATQSQLDLGGAPGEEDAHDDPVVLHELGHYVEATWGVYTNPGGAHNLEAIHPSLAWSEGFATWFQAVIRNEANYYDRWPTGEVYFLDLETTPEAVSGTEDGTPSGHHSEALVYGALWDLIDQPTEDDDASRATPASPVLSVCLGLLEAQDLGRPGADLQDFANDWRCLDASPENPLLSILTAYDFPLTEPACNEKSGTP